MQRLIEAGPVLLDIRSGIARITLNRPDVSNAMNLDLVIALHRAITACQAETGVRVVVLTGAGRNFCTGGDVKEFAAHGERLPEYTREVGSWLHAAVSALINLRAPVVTAVQGFAAGGGGLGLVCASDIVFAAQSTRLMSGAVRVGMAPDAGTTVALTQLVGLRKAQYLLLANPTVTSAEALEMGLVTRVVTDDRLADETSALADELAAGAPLALSATKHLLWQGVGRPVDAQIPVEARIVAELSGTADSREGLAAVIERRTPVFHGA